MDNATILGAGKLLSDTQLLESILKKLWKKKMQKFKKNAKKSCFFIVFFKKNAIFWCFFDFLCFCLNFLCSNFLSFCLFFYFFVPDFFVFVFLFCWKFHIIFLLKNFLQKKTKFSCLAIVFIGRNAPLCCIIFLSKLSLNFMIYNN